MGTLQVLNYRLVVLSCKVFISARAAPKSNFLTEVWSSTVEVLLAIYLTLLPHLKAFECQKFGCEMVI